MDTVNRINRHHNGCGRQTTPIMESATVASDKGSTTLGIYFIHDDICGYNKK